MKKSVVVSTVVFFLSAQGMFGSEGKKTDNFEFDFEGNTLRGQIESPVGKEPTSLVIIVPGSGKTNFFAEDNFYNDIRSLIVSLGMACCFWDKAGCGKSEGVFDGGLEQPIEKDADVVITAIEKLKRQKVPGSERIGLWGISRAGWICPFIIKKHPSIAFWIIVSGLDDNDQSKYFLKKKLIIQEGKSEEEAQLLTEEYWKGETIFVRGGSFEEYCAVTKNMRKDPYCVDQAGKTVREKYYYYQKKFLDLGFSVDHNTGMVDFIPGFKKAVSTIKCPVLAIFGEKDCMVNWRNTIQFYKENIGSNENSKLTIKTFPMCNHNIRKCKTGAYMEDLTEFGYEACGGYYDTMKDWIVSNGFGK